MNSQKKRDGTENIHAKGKQSWTVAVYTSMNQRRAEDKMSKRKLSCRFRKKQLITMTKKIKILLNVSNSSCLIVRFRIWVDAIAAGNAFSAANSFLTKKNFIRLSGKFCYKLRQDVLILWKRADIRCDRLCFVVTTPKKLHGGHRSQNLLRQHFLRKDPQRQEQQSPHQ